MRRKNNGSIIVLAFFAILIAGAVFLYNSTMFERNAPEVKIDDKSGYWNLRTPINVSISDDGGLKEYKVVLQSAKGERELASSHYLTPTKKVTIKIEAPRGSVGAKEKQVRIIVEARDASKWHFFSGNVAHKEFIFTVDRRRPKVSVLANSYKIARGGAALVVFKASDENLDKLYIKTSFGKVFHPTPFHKEGYYISLLAWPIQVRRFRAEVVAIDLAGNKVKAYIPLYLKNRIYKTSKITVTDRFLNGKVADLASEFDETADITDSIERFQAVNEDIRAKNEKLIHEITSKVPEEMVDDFHIKRMYPLRNGKVVASFGDHRYFYYKGKLISESYHMGLDLASKAMADIKTQNSGEVVYADFNGLYGNMPIIHHGLGLYTLYGHCSSLNVSQGDEVSPGDVIAKTGKTGYAMGDHLHFGVLVQGVEVRPQEWMDKKWIKLNITDVMQLAKKMIDKSE